MNRFLKYRFFWGILSITTIGAIFRFWNIGWDSFHIFHPDERAILMVAGGLRFPFNPRFFAYGSLPIYLIRAASEILSLFSKNIIPTEMRYLAICGRTISALLATLTIPLIYLISKRVFNRVVGIVTALLFAGAVISVQNAHFATVDTTLVFFITLIVYLSLVIFERHKMRDYILFGITMGLALATKFTALSVFPLLFLAHFMRSKEKGIAILKPDIPNSLPYIGAALLSMLITTLISAPYYLFDFKNFLSSINEQREILVSGVRNMPFVLQYVHTIPYIYQFKHYLLWSVGWPMGMLSLVGFVYILFWSWRNRNRGGILLILLWFIPYLLYIGLWKAKFSRYLLPLVPFFCMFGAKLIYDIYIAFSKRKIRVAVVWVSLVIVSLNFAYALSFLNIYRSLHTRIQGSKWIYENIPKGSVLLTEHWDEELPAGIDGDRREDYNIRTLSIYELPDDKLKMDYLIGNLLKGDYIAISSNRLYKAVLNVSERYPVTSLYYKLLFSERLGFRLINVFTSHPKILGLEIIDDLADESSLNYDHPKVLIFKKYREVSRQGLRDLFRNPPQGVKNLTQKDILLARLDRDGDNALAGEIETREESPIVVVLWWLIIIEFIGFLFLPLTLNLFRWMPDNGYSISKVIGILVFSYLVWLVVSLRIIPFSFASVLLTLVSISIVSGYFLIRNWGVVWGFLKGKRMLVLINEASFVFIFLIFLLIRMYNPEIYWGEKCMDFSFLNGVLRSSHFPPPEVWFSGYTMNYYYFGYVIFGALTKLSGFASYITYNLSVATIPALVIMAGFSLVYGLTKKISYAFIGGGFIGILGNLEGVRQAIFFGRPLDFHYFWSTTRIIPKGAIEEYPFWSFLFSDLHPHIIALPFLILLIYLIFNLASSGYKGFQVFGRGGMLFLNLILVALTLGVLIPTNTWDFPTALLIVFIGIVISNLPFEKDRELYERIRDISKAIILPFIVVVGLSILLFLPYHFHFRSLQTNYGLVKGDWAKTYHILLLFGHFLFIILSLGMFRIWRYVKSSKRVPILVISLSAVLVSVIIPAIFKLSWSLMVFIPFVIAVMCYSIIINPRPKGLILAMVFSILGLFLLEVVEFFYVMDRMNTIFKFYMHVWILFAIGSAYFLYYIIESLLPKKGVIRYVWLGLAGLLGIASMFTSITSVYAVINTNRVHTPEPTLDGMAYLKIKDESEYEAVKWINRNIRGTPVMLEAHGPAYQDYTRICMNTGLVTVLGWEHHMSQRGYHREDINKRRDEIEAIYGTGDIDLAKFYLSKYGVDYLYVGRLEKKDYPEEGIRKFDRFMERIYENEGVGIYKIPKGAEWLEKPVSPKIAESLQERYVIEEKKLPVYETAPPGEFNEPRGIAFDSRNNLYVVDTRNFRIQKFSQDGRFILEWGGKGAKKGQFEDPSGIAIDKYDNIFVADTWNQRIQKFSKDGRFKAAFTYPGGFYSPRGVAVDAEGNIFVSDTGNHRVCVLSPKGEAVRCWGERGSRKGRFFEPVGIALDQKGYVYVADSGNRRIQVFDKEGRFMRAWKVKGWKGKFFREPYIVFDNGGNIYLSDPPGHKILKYDQKGLLLRSWDMIGKEKYELINPIGISIDRSGKIYVSDPANNVVKSFNPND